MSYLHWFSHCDDQKLFKSDVYNNLTCLLTSQWSGLSFWTPPSDVCARHVCQVRQTSVIRTVFLNAAFRRLNTSRVSSTSNISDQDCHPECRLQMSKHVTCVKYVIHQWSGLSSWMPPSDVCARHVCQVRQTSVIRTVFLNAAFRRLNTSRVSSTSYISDQDCHPERRLQMSKHVTCVKYVIHQWSGLSSWMPPSDV